MTTRFQSPRPRRTMRGWSVLTCGQFLLFPCLEMVFGRNIGQTSGPRWFSIIVRNGNGPGGRFWSAGGATEMFAAWKDFRIGGEAEVWNQPSHGTGGGAVCAGRCNKRTCAGASFRSWNENQGPLARPSGSVGPYPPGWLPLRPLTLTVNFASWRLSIA